MHRSELDITNRTDDDGNPMGGSVTGKGVYIEWQDGPIDPDVGQTGALVEDIIRAAISRLKFYQAGKFACETNAAAINRLEAALAQMDARTADRRARGVEGKHEQ